MLDILLRQLRRVLSFDGGEQNRVANSMSAVIGDMSVAMAGTHVGKGRNSAAVRARDKRELRVAKGAAGSRRASRRAKENKGKSRMIDDNRGESRGIEGN